METKTLAKVNDVIIEMVIDNGTQLVPIKPICEALGIAYEPQRIKLKEDEFLNSTTTLSVVVAADGKDREMVCLPFRYIFGWLFTINPKNVKPEAKEAVAKYRIKCYDVLYEYFTEPQIFLEEQKKATDILLDEREIAKSNFRKADVILKEIEKNININRKMTIEEWREAHRVIEIPFNEGPLTPKGE